MRRILIPLALVVAALLSAPTSLTAEKAVATDVELVTVAESSAVFTWTTAARAKNGNFIPLPAISVLEFRAAEGGEWRQLQEPSASPYHRAELSGLKPDRPYLFRILASGTPLPEALLAQGSFSTLPRPPGDYLFSFATVADFQIALPGDPYYSVMARIRKEDGTWELLSGRDRVGQLFRKSLDLSRKAILDINRHDPAFTIVKGDLTQGSLESEFKAAKGLLDLLRSPYYVIPGNHDVLVLPGISGRESFVRYFPGERSRSVVFRGFRFLLLDTTHPYVDGGMSHEGLLDAEQMAWLTEQISASREPVFVLMHHPPHRISLADGRPAEPPLASVFSRGHVVGILAAHGHRNALKWKESSPPIVEGAPVVMYPGGYHIYRVYSGGYVQSFHHHGDLEALAESRSIQRRGPFSKSLGGLGEMDARNFTYVFGDRQLIPAKGSVTVGGR